MQVIPSFANQLKSFGVSSLQPASIDVLQINLGNMCNQTCNHCHVDAGPDRTEIMTRETMQACLNALSHTTIATVDLTGGAPEMNPHFKWFVTEIKKQDRHIIVRSNLTILTAKPYEDYPDFFKCHQLEVISSLPCYTEANTDAQRGNGVFKKSIKALRRLNRLGYGHPQSDLILNLVYNPGGPFLPPNQQTLEADYKRELKKNFGIVFNKLFTMTNMPINRFKKYLIESGKYSQYMHTLHSAYNPAAAENAMCRSLLSVAWDGQLYDCDFNQMLGQPVTNGAPAQIENFDVERLKSRKIVFGEHCYACTAGAGSSCTGVVV